MAADDFENDQIDGAVDLDALHENREKGAATTFKDRRRRASIYAKWPSHLAVHELAPTT